MKRVKITLKVGARDAEFTIFPTIEQAIKPDHSILFETSDVSGIDTVTLSKEEELDIVWFGCEYKYNRYGWRHFDYISIAKSKISITQAELASLHEGWVSGGLIPFVDYEDDDIIVERIKTTLETQKTLSTSVV